MVGKIFRLRWYTRVDGVDTFYQVDTPCSGQREADQTLMLMVRAVNESGTEATMFDAYRLRPGTPIGHTVSIWTPATYRG